MKSVNKEYIDEATRALYTRVAYYYHKRGLTQEEIAKSLQMSRQRVNRILAECLQLGIVEIRINSEDSRYLELEGQLEKAFGLQAVRVVNGITQENVYTELGLHGGNYLNEVVQDGDVIGFSRGRTLSAMVSQIPHIAKKNLTAVQLMGGWNYQQNGRSGDDIVHRFSERVGTKTVMLYAPVLLNDRELRNTIIKEPYFQQAYDQMKACNIAVLGIGQVGLSDLLPSEYGETLHGYLPKGAVGEICARFYDIKGKPVSSVFDERVIAIEFEDLMNIPLRIGIAGLPSKLPAILGAIRGGYVNVLLTDSTTAMAIQETLLIEEGKA